ncbi:putative PEP-binding protein [Streptomyces sp. GbtcB6]|uniref:putative PEP-binding protein n=1 Tax=Streptomyces sp. GbtcB6 TaxID=2824751 RepID=UPI001C3016BB|nr:putative PEP-binding protein [Streptomyces sp. GbtcB6]
MPEKKTGLPSVTLSGELPTADFLARTGGVGLIRSEYLVRHAGTSWAGESTRRSVADYLHALYGRAGGLPLWYRFSDLEARDVAVLRDSCGSAFVREDNPIIGVRALRRGAAAGSDLPDELRTMAALSRDLPQLGLLAPFVRDEQEVADWADALRSAGYAGALGVMVEIPSAAARIERILDTGVTYVVVGMNDLTGLTLGAARSTALHDYRHPAVLDLVHRIVEVARLRGVTVRVAGNFGPELVAALPELTASEFSFHYQDWADFRPDDALLAAHDKDLAAALRLASDARLIEAGLLDAENAVTIAGMRPATIGG